MKTLDEIDTECVRLIVKEDKQIIKIFISPETYYEILDDSYLILNMDNIPCLQSSPAEIIVDEKIDGFKIITN